MAPTELIKPSRRFFANILNWTANLLLCLNYIIDKWKYNYAITHYCATEGALYQGIFHVSTNCEAYTIINFRANEAEVW